MGRGGGARKFRVEGVVWRRGQARPRGHPVEERKDLHIWESIRDDTVVQSGLVELRIYGSRSRE